MIITRYLHREILRTTLVITAILLLIFICNQFVRYLSDAAIGRLTGHAVLQMMLIQVPLLAGFMLPLGFFLGLLLSYGRLYTDREMMVLSSCGVSQWQLVQMTMKVALVVTLVVAVLMIWVEPKMAWQRDHVLAVAAAASPLEKIAPGRFQLVAGHWVVYAQKMSRDRGKMQNVFIAELPNPKHKDSRKLWQVMSAESAKQVTDPNSGEDFIEFENGNRYVGIPGRPDYQVIGYGQYGMRVPERNAAMRRLEEFLPTGELWRERRENHLAAAELQWRLSMPISVFILGLLAISLSHVKPRQGKYGQLVPAVILYILYIDLLFVSRAWVEKNMIDSAIGMWWVHALMAALAVVLVRRYLKRV